MSRFTQEQQTEIIKHARDLTATIEFEERELNKLKVQKFKNVPTPPKHKEELWQEIFEPQYPPVPKTNYKYGDHIKSLLKIEEGTNKTMLIIVAILVLIFAGWIIGVAFIASVVSYFQKKKEINEGLANSPEYLQAVADAERIAKEKQIEHDRLLDEKQKEHDLQYEKDKEHYDNVILPQYKKEKEEWENNRSRKVSILEEEVRLNREMLTTLYDETKLVSVTYRPLWILCWLYDDMSSSDHEIRYATELLDKERQLLATEKAGQIVTHAVGKLENSMLQGMNAIYNAIDYGNALQEETITEISKVRRDMNIGNIIGTVQRHNTNKMLEELVPKKKK